MIQTKLLNQPPIQGIDIIPKLFAPVATVEPAFRLHGNLVSQIDR